MCGTASVPESIQKTKSDVEFLCFRAVWNFLHASLFDMEICGLGL
jgi:hypothetical protein